MVSNPLVSSVDRAAQKPDSASRPRFHAMGLVLPCLLLFTQSAWALVTVGPTGCTYTSLANAVADVMNDERAGRDTDPYIVVADGFVDNEVVQINSDNITSYKALGTPVNQAYVAITGGYHDFGCGQGSTGTSTISAAGKSAPALTIHGNKPVEVVLNQLTIANANTSGSGGGINFTGSGSLDLTNVDIINNQADYGAGILAHGLDSGITLTLHTNTRIHNNTANSAGGGVRIEAATHLIALESPTLIWMNTANPGLTGGSTDGSGGGLQVFGQAAVADIGGSYPGLGVISSNHARDGGGIAVQGGGGLRLFSTQAGVPALVSDNTADSSGGGLYVNGGYVCASGYAFHNNKAGLPNGALGEGSAIFLTTFSGSVNSSDVHLTEKQLAVSDGNAGVQCGHGFALPQRALCPIGIPCNEINGNGTSTDDDSILFVDGASTLVADRFESRGNHANYLALSTATLKLGDCLIAGNVTLSSLIAQSGVTQINGCTVAGNTITSAGTPLFITNGASAALTLANSILALNTSAGSSAGSLVNFGGTVQATYVIAFDTLSLAPAAGSNVNSLDPAFVDPANGDYHLKPESPAVDYHNFTDGLPLFEPLKDLDGRQRDVPLLPLPPLGGVSYDIGAYELQSLGDLIFYDDLEGFR